MVFIDFHGTLCHDLFWRSLPQDAQSRLGDFLFRDNLPLVTGWMRGELASEAVNQQVATAIDVPYDAVWEAFVSDCETMAVPAATLGQIEQLRAGAIVLLVTDNMDCFRRFTVPALGLDRHFDGIVNSSDTGVLKADGNGAIFGDLAAEWGVPIERCTLLDDSADACSNIVDLGGRAMRIDRPESLDHALQQLLSHY